MNTMILKLSELAMRVAVALFIIGITCWLEGLFVLRLAVNPSTGARFDLEEWAINQWQTGSSLGGGFMCAALVLWLVVSGINIFRQRP